MRSRLLPVLVVLAWVAPVACSSQPSGQASMRPTLDTRQVDGGLVAYQSGQPVPTFDLQPRARIGLDGAWRFQAAQLDPDLSFADRQDARARLAAEAGPRRATTTTTPAGPCSPCPARSPPRP